VHGTRLQGDRREPRQPGSLAPSRSALKRFFQTNTKKGLFLGQDLSAPF